MALTPIEKQVARQMIKYYSGDIPEIPEDDTRIQAFLAASENDKRLAIKAFLQNIVLPNEQIQLNNLNMLIASVQQRITQIQNYISS